MDKSQLKQKVVAQVDAFEDLLWQTVMSLYEHPEIAFKEFQSSALLANTLQEHGFEIERNVAELETAFRARQIGHSEGPTIAILGNVSQIIPAIHPYLETIAPHVKGHTIEFRETCVSPAGRAAMLDAAKAMAMT